MFFCNGKQAVCDIPCTNIACEHYDGTGARVIPEAMEKEIGAATMETAQNPFCDEKENNAFKRGMKAGFNAGKTEGRMDAYEELEGVILEAAECITNSSAKRAYLYVVELLRDLKKEADS